MDSQGNTIHLVIEPQSIQFPFKPFLMSSQNPTGTLPDRSMAKRDSHVASQNAERKLRIFLLSNVVPENAAGGQVVLYRHLIASSDFVLQHNRPATPRWLNSRFWKRLKSTRLHAACNALEISATRSSSSRVIFEQARQFGPNIVLTVAHGRGYDQARDLAERLNIPLATIFHDWWPDLEEIPPRWRRLEEARFRSIARASEVCFCVSEPMRAQLGSGGNATVLPPIPGRARDIPQVLAAGVGTIGYFGSLYDYGPMVAELAIASLDEGDVSLEIRTTRLNCPENQVTRLRAAGVLLPFAERQDFEKWISGIKAILCVMSFDPSLRRRMETSFPSKLIESLQFGKPVIIWGPEYCSAVQWAQANQVGHCITTPVVLEVMAELQAFLRNDAAQRAASQRAEVISKTVFSPQEIHRHFRQELWKVVRRHRRGAQSPAEAHRTI